MITLTSKGGQKVGIFLLHCKAKRKELLDAGKDTANNTKLPEKDDIVRDIEWFDEDDEYRNDWGVTDHEYLTIRLERGTDYIVVVSNKL